MRKELSEVATYERAKQGKVYPAGASTLQISATRGNIQYLNGPSEVATKYVVIMPSNDIEPYYFNVVLKRNVQEFMHAYKSGLNIQANDVAHFPIDILPYAKQIEISKVMQFIDGAEEREARTIDTLKDMKGNMLGGMFVG